MSEEEKEIVAETPEAGEEAPEKEAAEGEEAAPEEAAEPEPEPEPEPEAEPDVPPAPHRPSADPQLVETAKTFLTEAPPGEFDDIVASLKKCCKDPNVAECAKLDTIEEWMCSQCMPVEIEGHRAVICKEAQQEPGKYVDPHSNNIFSFDFENRKVFKTNIGSVNSTPLRTKIQDAVHKFASHSMKNGNCGAYDAKDGGVHIIVSGSSISRDNFRTGNLVMKFHYQNGHIKGTITIIAHFFENGNSYVKQESPFEEAVSGSNDDDIALDLTKKLSKFYSTWVSKMGAGFDLLRDEGLNKLRRRRPIKVDPINWRQEIIGAASMPVGSRH